MGVEEAVKNLQTGGRVSKCAKPACRYHRSTCFFHESGVSQFEGKSQAHETLSMMTTYRELNANAFVSLQVLPTPKREISVN